MNSPEHKAKAVPYRPRRASLNWIDYLVMAATVLTFAAVVAANTSHAAPARNMSTVIPASELPAQTSMLGSQAGMIKARIGLAMAGR